MGNASVSSLSLALIFTNFTLDLKQFFGYHLCTDILET